MWLGIPIFLITGSPQLHPIIRDVSASNRHWARERHVNFRDLSTVLFYLCVVLVKFLNRSNLLLLYLLHTDNHKFLLFTVRIKH